MTKRIKIEDPKDLREGMRVEYKYKGFIYKGLLRSYGDRGLGIDTTAWLLVKRDGQLNSEMTDIYQLINEGVLELTLSELKAIAAKEKGVDIDDITIKDE